MCSTPRSLSRSSARNMRLSEPPCPSGLAVTIRTGKQDLPRLQIERGHRALREEHHILFVQTEVAVLLKEAHRLLMILRAGHDEPGTVPPYFRCVARIPSAKNWKSDFFVIAAG